MAFRSNQPLSEQAARYEEREEGFGAAASCGELPDPLEINPDVQITIRSISSSEIASLVLS